MAYHLLGWAGAVLVLITGMGPGVAAENPGPADEAQLLAETDARIRRTRTAPLEIEVTDADGKPAANRVVKIEHVRHLFYFGAGFDARIMERSDETEVDRRHREQFPRQPAQPSSCPTTEMKCGALVALKISKLHCHQYW